MNKFFRRWLVKVIGGKEVGKLVTSCYNIVKPMYDGISYILEQLKSGKITQLLIDYITEIKSAIEAVIGLLKRTADFFGVELPEKKSLSGEAALGEMKQAVKKASEIK